MTNYAKLKTIIAASKLDKSRQFTILSFFTRAKDDDLKEIVALLEKDPSQIEMIYQNVEDKWNAKQDQSMWEDVLRKEEELLESIE